MKILITSLFLLVACLGQVQPSNVPGNSLMGNPQPTVGVSSAIGLGFGLTFSNGTLVCSWCSSNNSSGGLSAYSLIENNGTALPQRSTLNFLSGCSDNSGSSRTDCTIGSSSLSWIALPYSSGSNVIADLGAGNRIGQYAIDASGRVWLRGVVTCSMTSTILAHTTLFQLPSGFRPTSSTTMIIFQSGGSNGINVGITGAFSNLTDWVCTSGTSIMSFEGLSFSTNS